MRWHCLTRLSPRLFSLAILGLAAVCPAAHADLYSAQAAYHAGDYAKAFAEYKELAELGQPVAQLNLALMYLRGEGTQRSHTFAYAWALLAQENGIEQGSRLAEQVRPQLTPVSLRIAAEVHDQFSRQALDARLMPDPIVGSGAAARVQCRITHVAAREAYPAEALAHGVEGSVFLEAIVAPDGRAHGVRIINAVPEGVFEESVRRELRHATFAPASVEGRAVPCIRCSSASTTAADQTLALWP
jgi:uncharacterized protein